MTPEASTRAVLLDALGTLVELEPPWENFGDNLKGVRPPLGKSAIRAAFVKEMAFYREHAHEARDAESLGELRARCAALLSRELGEDVSVEAMMNAIRFRAFADAAPALTELHGRGVRLVCVSNWDFALPEVLDRVGLLDLLDAVVTSASVGVRKPDPRVFRAALAAAGCTADEALHVGDSAGEDVAGARLAGIRALLIDRSGGGEIATLAELSAHL
jgi:putative hydrolase of the HAD superfamily